MDKKFGSAALLAGTAAIIAGTTPATGQGLFGGGPFSFEVQSSLRVNDNLGLDDPSPGVSTLWDNTVTLGFLSETPVSQLRFDVGGTLRTALLPGTPASLAFDDPFAVFGYTLEGPNSRLDIDASYRRVNLSFLDPLSQILDEEELEDTDLIVDDGTRITTNASLRYEGGLTDPFGYGVELGHQGIRYSGTADPGLFDSWTNSAAVFTRFTLSPVAEARVSANWAQYDADDAVMTSRQTLGLTAGLTYEISPITRIDASLGYNYITETTNLPSTTVTTGLNGSFGITREMPNGSAGLVLASTQTTNGRRSSLTANRAMELPTGSLAASLGVSYGPSGDFIPVGSLVYVYAMPRGEITASLRHSASLATGGGDVVTTAASLGYRTEINALSSLSFDADFASVSDLGAADKTTLTSLRAAYSYELTPELDLSAGYEHRIRTETGMARRSSNEVFLVLDYKFDNPE